MHNIQRTAKPSAVHHEKKIDPSALGHQKPTRHGNALDETAERLRSDRPQALKLGFTIAEVCEALGICRSRVYLEIDEGRLRMSKIGRRSIVLAPDLVEYVARLRAGGVLAGRAEQTKSP